MLTQEENMADTDPTLPTPDPRMEAPTALGAKFTLPPGGRQTLRFKIDHNMLLEGIEAEAEGPAVLEYEISDSPPAGTSVDTAAPQSFQEYLTQEYPIHLAALVGEDLSTWSETNQALRDRAMAGDNEAFFELLARDPRLFSSELALGRIVTWRTAIQTYNRFYRAKASRMLVAGEAGTEAERKMEAARQNLTRLGASQLEPFDLRGKRPLPPGALVRGVYYGLLCLIRVLRLLWDRWAAARHTGQQIEREMAGTIADLKQARTGFLFYVALGAQLILDSEVLTAAGLDDVALSTLVRGRGMGPAETARQLTGAAFEVSSDTVERLAGRPFAIPLPPEGTKARLLIGPRTLDPLLLPEVKALIAKLTR
jgi:hypothetical protein